MKRLSQWRPISDFRPGLLRFGGVFLAGATLLTLALAVSGLILPASAASAAPFKPPPRPTATPTQPRSTPTPRPTATTAPGPTATAAATAPAAATSTAHPGTNTGGTNGAGSTQSQSAASLLWSSLLWGLGAVVVALLMLGAFIWLFARRAARERQQQSAFPDYARAPSRERLNQLYQMLPSRNVPAPTEEEREAAETPLAEEDTAPLWTSPSEVSWPSSPRPPQWLTEAGLLKDNTLKDSAKKQPPEAQQEP